MIIVIIICGILYLLMVYSVLYLYYTYRKDIEEIENRLLQLEKRTSYKKEIDIILTKEGDTMACKKGRGGKKK